MNWLGDLLDGPLWPLAFLVVYPIVAVLAIEVARALDGRDPFSAGVVREVVYGLLPAGAVWLILAGFAGLPPENVVVRVAETVFALTALYLVLKVLQALLAWLIGDEAGAPRLLLETARIAVALLWGAVVISRIWNIDLGSLLAAMGVGSIVLAFALQEFVGNMLSGLGLLSTRKFEVGDWLVVDGRPQKVAAFDWRSATLVDSSGTETVVANNTLAKGNLVISARAGTMGWATLVLTLGVNVPPEEARAAILEAAESVPGLPPGSKPRCSVTGIHDQRVSYLVELPVDDPGATTLLKDEFLSRFWYVAQRWGISLETAQNKLVLEPPRVLRMLQDSGAVRRHPDVLAELVNPEALRRYRRGDVLMLEGRVPSDALLVAAGSLGVFLPVGGDSALVETVGSGQLLVLQETISGTASPVRVVAETNADVVAIPRSVFVAAVHEHHEFARDVNALAAARRNAIAALQRSLSRAA